METIFVMGALGLFTVLLIWLGYEGQRDVLGLGLTVGALGVTFALCFAGWIAGNSLFDRPWLGLGVGSVLTGVIVPWGLGLFIKGRSVRVLRIGWAVLCALLVLSYSLRGASGLVTIALPAVGAFALGWYVVAGYILPLRDESQRGLAARALATFTLGTNFPYYLVGENNKLDERIGGNPFAQFFAGPGLILSRADQAAYVSDKMRHNRVMPPGLNFTDQFDVEPSVVDLRTQLRAFYVSATTCDGIAIKVLAFVPYRIKTGGQVTQVGQPFPFDEAAVHQAMQHKLVERQSVAQQQWDDTLIKTLTTPIMRQIIGEYNANDLCQMQENYPDPRDAIAAQWRERIKAELEPLGLEVVGGGIGNLMPEDARVVDQRIETWQTTLKMQIEERRIRAEMERALLEHQAKMQTEQAMVNTAAALPDFDLQLASQIALIDSIEAYTGPYAYDELDESDDESDL